MQVARVGRDPAAYRRLVDNEPINSDEERNGKEFNMANVGIGPGMGWKAWDPQDMEQQQGE